MGEEFTVEEPDFSRFDLVYAVDMLQHLSEWLKEAGFEIISSNISGNNFLNPFLP